MFRRANHVATHAELEVDDLYTCMFASRITTSAASITHTRYGDRGTTADEAGQFGHTVICDSARLQSLQQQQQPGVLAQGGVPPVVVQCVAVQQPEYQRAVPGSTVVTATVVSTPVAASRTGYADGGGTAGAVAARTCMLEGILYDCKLIRHNKQRNVTTITALSNRHNQTDLYHPPTRSLVLSRL